MSKASFPTTCAASFRSRRRRRTQCSRSVDCANEERTMYQTRNDLAHELREKMIAILNRQLADLIDLRTQAKVAHWNVKGPHFAELHKLFDEIAESVDGYADLVAERAAQLGGIVRGTARQVAASTELEEHS